MNDILRVVGIQATLFWENPEKNRMYFETEIARVAENADLIVLPEMFTTGFSMNASHLAEDGNGETIDWMKTIAQQYSVALVGSIIYKDGNSFYNRLFFVKPNGGISHYDKRHTFTLAGEHQVYQSGKEVLIVTYKGWRICPLICYDLRFPVWSRNSHDYDVLIYIASWPVKRVKAWDILLRARAIENMSYVIGVNRIGTDANNYEYSGHSALIDFMGNTMNSLEENTSGIIQASLIKKELQKFRKKLGFLDDRDSFTIH